MNFTPFEDHPTWGVCPKCNRGIAGYDDETSAEGDRWVVRFHEYEHDDPFLGSSWPKGRQPHLDWSCPHCGHSVRVETADAATVSA